MNLNQKEVALQEAIKKALRQYGGEFYLDNTKIEDVAIKWLFLKKDRCVCPVGLDSSNWDQCKEGICDAELKLSYKTGLNDSLEVRCETKISINFKVTNYKDGVFTVEIEDDKLNMIKL